MFIFTDQKAWRKKQLCYKLTRKNICHSVVTDIILLNKNKRAPDGFTLIGYINVNYFAFYNFTYIKLLQFNY